LLFCSDRAGDTEIYEMKLSGRILRKLKTDDSGKKFNPEYSPDGRRAVFYVEKGDNKDQIHLMDINSRDSKNLTQDNHHNYYPSWLDNDTILFVRLDESVWTIDSQGNNRRRLVLPPTEIVRIGPGLNQLTFVNSDAESIVVLDRRSGEQRVLLTSKNLPAN
jgi:Tol biopolymer transport system component